MRCAPSRHLSSTLDDVHQQENPGVEPSFSTVSCVFGTARAGDFDCEESAGFGVNLLGAVGTSLRWIGETPPKPDRP
jgi:hypothetical protein